MGADQQQSSAEVEAKNSRFPSGRVRIVTEIPRIAEKLHKISIEAGILLEAAEDGVVIRVDDAGEDSACLVLASSLPPDEQDAVFLLLDHAPHLRSLRSVLGKCQYAWLFDVIEDGRWESEYQPVFDVETGMVFGREALLRARMSDGTRVSPAAVIEAARVTRWLPLVDELARNASLRGAVSAFPNEERILEDLGILLSAEGIEDPDDLKFVREAGVRYAQGYLLGRPAPPPLDLNLTHDARADRIQP